MKKGFIAIGILFCPVSIYAGNYNIDARIEAMGGAGTVAASFLSAGFYNPALLALDPKKAVGVLFPTIGVEFRDPESLVKTMEDFGSVYNSFLRSPTDPKNKANAANALRNITNQSAYLSGGIGGAVAVPVPSSHVGVNFFVKGYTEVIVLPDISDADITAIESGSLTTLQSKARVLAFGVLDVGLALGTKVEVANRTIAVGFTPKAQKIYSYHYEVSIDRFNLDKWDAEENRTQETLFNVDFGAAWDNGPYRVGFVAKNLISHDVTTAFRTRNYTYHMKPLYTLGTAFVTDFLTLTMDLDLNKQSRFSTEGAIPINDDTQFFRLGTEFNAWGQFQLRAGYIKDLENTLDPAFTLGVGLSPLDTIGLDLAAKIIDSNSFGGSLQLSFTF